MSASQAEQKDHWSAEKYSKAAAFVPQLTQRIVGLLAAQPGDEILDIGCGDGILSAAIAKDCAQLVGLDASASFIASAQEKYQAAKATFLRADCRRLSQDAQPPEVVKVLTPGSYDKVFSNAALHWILRSEDAREHLFGDVFALLKPGGRFVFEMGGHQNVGEAHAALRAVLYLKYNVPLDKIAQVDPFFFPPVDWIKQRLEAAGFAVDLVESKHRPTRLTPKSDDGAGGLEGWLRLMGAAWLEAIDTNQRDDAVRALCELLDPIVTREEDGSQWLGNVRLRAVATRPA